MLIAVDAANSRFMLLNPSGNNRPRSIIFGHTESAGTDGGTFTSGSWVDRVLNAVFYNDGMNGSLLAFSGDTIILQPGTYDVDGWAIGFNVNRHQLVMRTAGGADHIVGSSENTTGTATGEEPTGTKSFISGRIVVTTPTTYSFKHRCSSTQATTGLGAAANFGVAEIYAQFKITEVLAN
jgi:hypothetical protein